MNIWQRLMIYTRSIFGLEKKENKSTINFQNIIFDYKPQISLYLNDYDEDANDKFFKVWLETYLLSLQYCMNKPRSEYDGSESHISRINAEKAVKEFKEFYDNNYKEKPNEQ